MTKARSLWPRRRGARRNAAPADHTEESLPVPAERRVTATTVAECLRACAAFRGGLDSGDDRKRIRLAEALDALTGAAGGARAGTAVSDDAFEALLTAGNRALECGPDTLPLALLLCDTALTARRKSRAGWRLRGRVADAQGDEEAAVEAYERHLALSKDDAFNVTPRYTGLKIAQWARTDALRVLARDCPGAEEFSTAPHAATWAEGVALHGRGEEAQAALRLVGALLAKGRAGGETGLVDDFQDCLGEYLDLRIAAARGDASTLGELAGLYATHRRNRMRAPLADPTLGGVGWVSLGEFRNLLAGKSVCLVANSERAAHSSLGPEIDAYDLVVRFTSYALDAPHTGTRTDIHATGHDFGFNWDQRVGTRLVFGGESEKWRYWVRERLVVGAQDNVTDESCRWPLRNVGGVHWDRWPSVPTTGFNTLWLLDFLDVSPVIDLIGFDFYEGGVHRLPRAMDVPVTSEREYTNERAWVMDRAQSVTDLRISLR